MTLISCSTSCKRLRFSITRVSLDLHHHHEIHPLLVPLHLRILKSPCQIMTILDCLGHAVRMSLGIFPSCLASVICSRFPSITQATEAKLWVNLPAGYGESHGVFDLTSHFPRLQRLKCMLCWMYAICICSYLVSIFITWSN